MSNLVPSANFHYSALGQSTIAASNSAASTFPPVTHKVAQTFPSIKLQLNNLLSYALPKELTSIVHEYSLLSRQEMTLLFLKLLFADQYVDESLAKECHGVAQFWLKETTHLDLSKVKIHAIGTIPVGSSDTMTIEFGIFQGFFENVIQKYFPSLKTIEMPNMEIRGISYRTHPDSFVKITELLSFNGQELAIQQYKESATPCEYLCYAQFNKKTSVELFLTAKTEQRMYISDLKNSIFSARFKDLSVTQHRVQDVLRTALPRDVNSLIYHYADFAEKEISELFLKLLFSDQFVDESLTRECDDIGRFWFTNITHLDLSRIQIHIQRTKASKSVVEQLTETIREIFPNLRTINLPKIFVNHDVMSITRLDCSNLTIIRHDDSQIDYFCHVRQDSHEMVIVDPSESSNQTIFKTLLNN